MQDYATPVLDEETRYMTAFFATRRDVRPDPYELTWDELANALLEHVCFASKHEASLWSPTRYREGTTRGREGVQEVTLLVADVDDGTAPDELEEWLHAAHCSYLLASTWSHTAEHPKLRVIVPLARPIPVAEYDEVWRRFNEHVLHARIDPSTKDPSRMYYLPSCPLSAREIAVEKRVDDELLTWDTLPVVVPPIRAQIRPDPFGAGQSTGDEEYRARCFLAKWQGDLAVMPVGSGRHNALRSKAVAAGGLVASGLLHEREASEVLLAACEENGLTQDPGGAAARTIEDGLKYGALTPWRPGSLPDTPVWRARLESPRIGTPLEQRSRRAVGRSLKDADRPTGRSDYKMPDLVVHTAAELGRMVLPDIAWLVRPYVVAGGLTELVGKVKAAGKTTWLCEAMRCALDGLEFLGAPTTRTPVVLLTEQSGHSLREALARAKLLEREDLHIVEWYEHSAIKWPEVVAAAAQLCVDVGARLLVVDTLSQWAGLRGDAENHAGDAMEAVRPLQEAAASCGVGVIYTRHERKSGGDVGDSGRGSSAYAGAVDIILSLRRGNQDTRETVRYLESLSRYDETPHKVSIELVNAHYVVLADNGELAFTEVQYEIVSALKMHQRLRTRQFIEMVSCKETQLKVTLRILTERGTIRRGEVRGGGFEYWLPEEPDVFDL